MKQQEEQQQVNQELKNTQNENEKISEQIKEQQPNQGNIASKNLEIPPQNYTFSQLFSIRKQSINAANDLIYKRLTKSFHKIKKLRNQSNGGILSKEYDYENNSIRKDFRNIHDLYNMSTKTNQIVKKKIDKMRSKVDRIKNQIQQSELFLIKEVDFNKIYNRTKLPQNSTQPNGQSNPQSSQNIGSSVSQKQKTK